MTGGIALAHNPRLKRPAQPVMALASRLADLTLALAPLGPRHAARR
jgi:hypothetical protein